MKERIRDQLRGQEEAPLWTALQTYRDKGLSSFHVPAHKGGRGLDPDFLQQMPYYDLTELPGLDNLLLPTGPIAEAQRLAAALVGAKATYFTTNGSTAGLIAAVLACCKPGSTVLLPQNAHISLLHACVLGDVYPAFLGVQMHESCHIPLGYAPDQLKKAILLHRPSLVVAVSPTYHGVISDLKSLADVCREEKVPLLVDEAHGTHLLASFEPLSSALSGASLVVQSVHKTGGALTGAAWVHCFDESLCVSLKEALRLVQSTSPSYLLLASLDLARRALATYGPEHYQRVKHYAREIRHYLRCVELPAAWQQDPLRIVVNAKSYGLSGSQLESIMLRLGVAPEMHDAHTVTLVLGLTEDKEVVEKMRGVAEALAALPLPLAAPRAEQGEALPLPVLARSPREVHYGQKEWVALASAAGRIAAAPLTPYPPGVPLVWPGQRITLEIIEYIQKITESGGFCINLSESGQILVVAGEI